MIEHLDDQNEFDLQNEYDMHSSQSAEGMLYRDQDVGGMDSPVDSGRTPVRQEPSRLTAENLRFRNLLTESLLPPAPTPPVAREEAVETPENGDGSPLNSGDWDRPSPPMEGASEDEGTAPEEMDSANTQSGVKSHSDLKNFIKAQLDYIQNKKDNVTPYSSERHSDEARQPASGATHQASRSPLMNAAKEPSPLAPGESAPIPQDEEGAEIVEIRPQAKVAAPHRAFEPAGPQGGAPAQTPGGVSSSGPAAGHPPAMPRAGAPEAIIERVNGNLMQLASGPGSILRRIMEEKLNGQLLLISEGENENRQELVYIQDGMMVACSSLLNTQIRKLLLSAGLIRIEDLEAAERWAAASGGNHAVESYLIRQGLITKEQIFETLGVCARETVVTLMSQEFGLFVWNGVSQVAAPKILCKVPMREVALHYGRSVQNFEQMQPGLFNPNRIFKIHETFNLMHTQYRLLPHEWKFLFRVDGKRTLQQIRETIDINTDELNRHVFVGALMGFITDCGLAKEDVPAIPLSVPVAAPVVAPEHPGQAAPVDLEPALAIDDRPKILIVDDSRTVQKMVAMTLADQNYLLRTADDGIEALQYIADEAPDLVLLDVIMPKMDGYKVCSRMRKALAPKKIPIIMLTAKDGTYNNIRAKLAGATTVINKPFDTDELRQTVKKYLQVDKK